MDELDVHPAEFGNLANRTTFVEIAEACRKGIEIIQIRWPGIQLQSKLWKWQTPSCSANQFGNLTDSGFGNMQAA